MSTNPIGSMFERTSSCILTSGRPVLPMAVDQIAYYLFLRNSTPLLAYLKANLAGAVSLFICSRYATHKTLEAGLYLGYKAIHYFFLQLSRREVINEPSLHPSVMILWKKFEDLREHLTFSRDDDPAKVNPTFMQDLGRDLKSDVRRRWEDPIVIAATTDLMKASVNAMIELFKDLKQEAEKQQNQETRTLFSLLANFWPAATTPPAVFKKMATLLTSKETLFYHRFCREGSITLLDIYRLARGKQFFMLFTKVSNQEEKRKWRDLELEEEDGRPYMTPGTVEYTWKKMYNGCIDLWGDVIEHFPKHDPRYAEWATKDTKLLPTGPFFIFPNTKPS